MFADIVILNKKTPCLFYQAQRSEQRNEWIEVYYYEIAAHHENKTWTLIPCPKPNQDGKKYIIMRGIWHFQIKTEDEKIKSYKACYYADESSVTKKLNSDPELGFEDNYSKSATSISFNLIYMVAAMYGLEVDYDNVPGVYLKSKMPKGNIVYYVEQPEGFKDLAYPDWVCMLNKALYGVPIAGQRWNLTFQKFFVEELGFKCSKSESNLYI